MLFRPRTKRFKLQTISSLLLSSLRKEELPGRNTFVLLYQTASLSVPVSWADFFIAKLLSSEDFVRVKNILQSKLWQLIQEGNSNGLSFQFFWSLKSAHQKPRQCALCFWLDRMLPRVIPPPQALRSSHVVQVEHFSTSVVHIRRRQQKTPLVVSEVSRSARLKQLAKGYKGKTCLDKDCLACAADTPPLNKKVVKSLYDKFGMVESKPPVQKKQKTSKKVPDDAKTKKNPKKK
uniref:Uncharacterized protein n=1 Tax=Aegilops tauschii subsp. strangulata TaxID=200361 RepID=A0A453RVM9_AEGTS